MTYEERQAHLLDTYLTALQDDPSADPPPDLDLDMATFAQMLVGDQPSTANEANAKGRVWQAIQPQTPNNIVVYEEQERDRYMKNIKAKNKRSPNNRGWLPLVATAAVSVLVTFILGSVIFGGDDNIFARMMDRPSDDGVEFVLTSTPVASATFTPTATHTQPFDGQVTNMPPTTIPPVLDPFMMTATALVQDATERSNLPIQSTPASVDSFMMTATALVREATQQVVTATMTATPTIPFTPTAGFNPMLDCNFEGEFDMQLNGNLFVDDEILRIEGVIYNSRTTYLTFEIFGGEATNDEYLPIASFTDPATNQAIRVQLPADSYEDGSYLVQIKLEDANRETLSSCGLPVTFTSGG